VGLPLRQQVRNALTLVQSRPYVSSETKANDLETLFKIIAKNNPREWDFRRVRGSDNSNLFVGPEGPAVAVAPSGKLFKGLVSFQFFHALLWPADYSELDEIP
jgi:hypothetical protein